MNSRAPLFSRNSGRNPFRMCRGSIPAAITPPSSMITVPDVFSQQHGAADNHEQDRDADQVIEPRAVEAEDDVLRDVQGEQKHGEYRGHTQEIVLLHRERSGGSAMVYRYATCPAGRRTPLVGCSGW